MNGTGPENSGQQMGRKLGICSSTQEKNPDQLGKGMGKRLHSGGGPGLGKRLKYDLFTNKKEKT